MKINPMKDKAKKICRLSYILICCVVSSFIFLIPNTHDSLMGEKFWDYLYKNVYEDYYFLKCTYDKKKTNFGANLGTRVLYLEKCPHKTKNIELDGRLMNADNVINPKRSHVISVNKDYQAINEFNDKNKNKIRIRLHTTNDFDKTYRTNTILMYIGFFASFILIWFSRNISIHIFSLITKGTVKGWKKL
jgi:hypothetical protein